MHNETTFRVYGAVVSRRDARPIEGVRVQAFDRDFFREQSLGSAITDRTGSYEIRFTRADFTGPVFRLERAPDLFLSVRDRDGLLLHSTRKGVVTNAGADTRIDVRVPWPERPVPRPDLDVIGSLVVDRRALAALSVKKIVEGYRFLRHRTPGYEFVDELVAAFPGLLDPDFTLQGGCREGLRSSFDQVLAERGEADALGEADADEFPTGTTVKSFFTENVVVKYTVDAGSIHAVDPTVPGADADLALPGGAVIGQVRAALADLHPDNTEVAPTYVQKVGLFAEYALSSFVSAPFSFRDPRDGATRMEYRILDQGGNFGSTDATWTHVEVAPGNDDERNSFTPAHELLHQVQYRYHDTTTRSGIYGVLREGGARFVVESINDVPNRYVWHGGGGTFWESPDDSLVDDPYAGSTPLRYQGGMLWKYIAEHHSVRTGAGNEPAIGVETYRTLLEKSATLEPGDPGLGYTVQALRDARRALPWYGSFDGFHYIDPTGVELSTHETTWGNFLVANYLHGTVAPGDPGHDPRYDYLEDPEPVSYSAWVSAGVTALEDLRVAIPTADDLAIGQDESIDRTTAGHLPWAARYYRVAGQPASPPRMLRITFEATSGMSAPLVQILRLGAGESLVDLHRCELISWAKTINFEGLEAVIVIVASRDDGGDYTVQFDEVAASTDVQITRWNTRAGTEYEVDPKGWAWTWVSPDVMVDNNGDGLADTEVFFDQDNTLKVRLRNRGNEDAAGIDVDFYYQKATPHLSPTAWMPVRDAAGLIQTIVGETLGAGDEKWVSVDWAPENDGSDHPHWCVKAEVQVAGDPNADNKLALSNFGNVIVPPDSDTDFGMLVRIAERTRDYDLRAVPRGPRLTLDIRPPAGLPRPNPVPAHLCRCCFPHPTAARAGLSRVAVRKAALEPWDRRQRTLQPDPDVYYPIDPAALPPGVDPESLVTVVLMEEGEAAGGVTYQLRSG